MAAYTSTTMDDARGIEQQLCLRGGGKKRKTHLSSFFLREKCSDRCLINRRHTIMSRCFMALGPIVHCATIAFYPIVPSSRTKHTYNVPSLSLHLLSPPSFSCVLEEEQFYLQHQTCTPLQRPSSIGPRRASGLGPVARWPWYDAERFVQFVPTFLVKIMTEQQHN